MKVRKLIFLVAFLAACSTAILAQDRFTNCTAAYLDNKLLVNEYSPSGYCKIRQSAKGELTVQTMNDEAPTGKTRFLVAIRDGNSKTLLLFSEVAFLQVPVEKLLKKCKPGDAIVLLTTDDKYALPHHEILVTEGAE